MTNHSKEKVFVLGLDGVCLEVLAPLVKKGAIPHLSQLLREGAHGPMRTVFPPVTAPAWLALATGLNPGKTGVFDYINRSAPHGAAMQPVSSRDYCGRAVWDLLGTQGVNVGIFNYPTLSPPPEVNGFVVSGMGAYPREHLCFPASLDAEIQRVAKGYEHFLNLRNPGYRRDIFRFFADIERILEKQAAVLVHLMNSHAWDFFFGVLSITDWMQHVLWNHLDPTHPQHEPAAAAAVQSRYCEVWGRIDALVGEISRRMPEGSNLIIVSDHGAGALDSVFYPNVWLEQKGWTVRRKSWKGALAGWIGLFAEGSDSKYALRLGAVIRNRVLKICGIMDLIDFERSLAYSPEHNTMFGCINFTERGRQREGFAGEVAQALRVLPEDGIGVRSVEVFRPEALYAGPYAAHAPDLLFVVNGYRSTVEIDFARTAFRDRPSLPLRPGGHREDGVFIARGPAFRRGWEGHPSILDVAPTILALYGAEIPSSVDGKVLLDALSAEATAQLDVRYGVATETAGAAAGSEEEMEAMKDMLKSLGYL